MAGGGSLSFQENEFLCVCRCLGLGGGEGSNSQPQAHLKIPPKHWEMVEKQDLGEQWGSPSPLHPGEDPR